MKKLEEWSYNIKMDNCKYCNKEINRKLRPRSEYCCIQCKNSQVHKNHKNDKEWTKRRSRNVKRLYHNSKGYREKAIRRALDRKKVKKRFCELCKKEENLQLHHLSYNPSKYIVVCVKCHTKLHYGN